MAGLDPAISRRRGDDRVNPGHDEIMSDQLGDALARLWATIEARRGASPETSYTAKLLAAGPTGVARKFGEETLEAIIEAVNDDSAALARESADVLYHLLVLWATAGLSPDDIGAELMRREGVSGIEEKRNRRRRQSDTPS
jgi:phosphoribosyl-ATP pyrophosphohydrolase